MKLKLNNYFFYNSNIKIYIKKKNIKKNKKNLKKKKKVLNRIKYIKYVTKIE